MSLNLPNSITSLLKSLHWLKIQLLISIVKSCLSPTGYKTLQSGQSSFLHSLHNVQSNGTSRSSDVISLQRPSVRSRRKVTDRSFTHAYVRWNYLPATLGASITRRYNGFYSSTCPLLVSVSLYTENLSL